MVCLALVLLVYFLPLVAALIFLGCVTFIAITIGKTQGFWKGLWSFFKDILFGW